MDPDTSDAGKLCVSQPLINSFALLCCQAVMQLQQCYLSIEIENKISESSKNFKGFKNRNIALYGNVNCLRKLINTLSKKLEMEVSRFMKKYF